MNGSVLGINLALGFCPLRLVSGGGLMLSSSNSAATVAGRIDPITTEVIITTSAIVSSRLLSFGERRVNFVSCAD